jgi:MoaA/NifB/PqqE/SkfB family radical SAM enzyme
VSDSHQLQDERIKPELAVLALTSRCNSRCVYCDSWKRPVQEPPLTDLFYILEELKKLGVEYVHVGCGEGEELMRADFPLFIKHALELDLGVQFQTNGILATRERLQPIVELGPMHITLSFDSFNPSIYERLRGVPFELAERALETMLKLRQQYQGLSISTTCVVSALNLSGIIELVTRFDALGIYVGLQPYHSRFCNGPSGLPELLIERDREMELREVFSKLLEMKRNGLSLGGSEYWLGWMPEFLLTEQLPPAHECRAGYNVVTIDSRLNVRSCWMLGSVGNLKTETPFQIWHSAKFSDHRQRMLRQECPRCWLASYVERWQT